MSRCIHSGTIECKKNNLLERQAPEIELLLALAQRSGPQIFESGVSAAATLRKSPLTSVRPVDQTSC
jgi:hypothetical protein